MNRYPSSIASAAALALLGSWSTAQEPPPEDPLGGLRLTVFGNALGRRDDKGFVDSDGNHLDDRESLRSLGLRLTAPVADIGRGVVFARWSEDPMQRFESQVDEAFVEIDPLPIAWEPLKDRLDLKVGRFRAPFGRANRWHLHELPQITRPLPVRRLLGEDGLIQTGLACGLDVPTGSERVDFLVTLQLTRDFPLDEALTPFVNLDLRLHASPRDRVDLGLTIDNSRDLLDYGYRQDLRGADLTFAHATEPGSAGSFLLGSEFLRADVSHTGGDDRPRGTTTWGQLEVVPDWFVGARYDTSDAVTDDTLTTSVLGGYLTWVAHPRLRAALGYEHTSSDEPQMDGLDSLLLELNFVFGSPAPGPEWLERTGR